MTRNYRVLLATNVLAMSVVLLLSVIAFPLAFRVYASTDPSNDLSTNNLNSNDTGSADPLSNAVLTLGDGSTVLSGQPATSSTTDTSGTGRTPADSGIGSTSDSSSSDSPNSVPDSSSVDDSSSGV